MCMFRKKSKKKCAYTLELLEKGNLSNIKKRRNLTSLVGSFMSAPFSTFLFLPPESETLMTTLCFNAIAITSLSVGISFPTHPSPRKAVLLKPFQKFFSSFFRHSFFRAASSFFSLLLTAIWEIPNSFAISAWTASSM